MEEGEAFDRLLSQFAWTQEELAQRVGKDRSSISNALRLLRLPLPIQEDLRSGRLTMGHARALLALATPAEQLKLRDDILAHDWSVRATEDSIRTTTESRPRRPKQRRRSAELSAVEDALQRNLMTRVRIVGSERQGRIEVTYANAGGARAHCGIALARDTDFHAVKRIVVGMSGGVDSSVAAALLSEAGHEVVGVTMRVWPWQEAAEAPARFGSCCGTDAVEDARRVAGALGIPYYVLNMADEFDRKVIAPFADAYRDGRTPVPCLACNSDLKFGSLLARAAAWDAAAVATGHYARVERDAATGRWRLLRPRDLRKDQTDFLWPLTQAQLGAARFPIGDLTKDEVREYARRLGLVTADKPESQEICFVPDGNYRGFLRQREPAAFRAGSIVDVDGQCARPPRGGRRLHDRSAARAGARRRPCALRR